MPLDFLGGRAATAPSDSRVATLPGPRGWGRQSAQSAAACACFSTCPAIDGLDTSRVVLSAALSLFGPADKLEVALAVPEEACEDPEVLEQISALCQDVVDGPGGAARDRGLRRGRGEGAAVAAAGRRRRVAREVGAAVMLLTATAQQVWDGQSGSRAGAPCSDGAGGARRDLRGNDRMLVVPQYGGKMFCSASDLSITPDLAAHGVLDPGLTTFLHPRGQAGHGLRRRRREHRRLHRPDGPTDRPEGQGDRVRDQPARCSSLLRDNVSINYVGEWVEIRQEAAWSRGRGVDAARLGRLPGQQLGATSTTTGTGTTSRRTSSARSPCRPLRWIRSCWRCRGSTS